VGISIPSLITENEFIVSFVFVVLRSNTEDGTQGLVLAKQLFYL
jgi:hypothetical protein